MMPNDMIDQANEQNRRKIFERRPGSSRWSIRRSGDAEHLVLSMDPIQSLTDIILPSIEQNDDRATVDLFVDLIHKMLAYRPDDRITPREALSHPFISEARQRGVDLRMNS